MVARCFVHLAHPLRILGNIIEAHLPNTQIGEICEIQRSIIEPEHIGNAQVIGFNKEYTILSLLNDNLGYSRNNVILPTGKHFTINISDNMVGAIINSSGQICGWLDGRGSTTVKNEQNINIHSQPKDFTQRRPISEILTTGVRAIDGLLTCGKGQRMGIFAAAGCGKTSLMNMIVEHCEADLFVIGLVGERGREVTEFIDDLRRLGRSTQVILVYATSDRSCVERCNAALIASTIAEYFSEQGKNVLLFIDSITRYARALRDVALSLGELPARRGYPASVFESLPKLLERPGCFIKGSVTAFYTVLIENEEEPDVIGDEVRSILDGHIYLSKKLAFQGHYPAVDILQSISRVFTKVTDSTHQQAATLFREYLVRQQSMQLFIDMGEYRRGENKENDLAFDRKTAMESFLKQKMTDKSALQSCLDIMNGCLA